MERRRRGLFLLGVVALSTPGWARVNVLESWAPGFDASVSESKWNHSAHVGVLNSGAEGTDTTELGYALTMPVGTQWEVGGTWGYSTLDSSGVRNDAGMTDIAVAVKRRIPETRLPAKINAVAEVGVSLPTADPDHGIGAGGFGFLGNAGLSLPLEAVRGYAQVGLKLYTPGRGTHWGNVFTYSVGAMYSVRPDWMVSADVRVISHGKDKIDGVELADSVKEAYLAPGGVWRPAEGLVEVQGLLLVGLTADSSDFGMQVGVRF